MPLRPHGPPKQLPIDLEIIETSKGRWLIAVETIVETMADGNLLLKLILEQSIDDEHLRMRELGVKIKFIDARDPDRSATSLTRIRDWIESTEGNGFIDMSTYPNSPS
jgi:hypothetical protein